MPDPTLPIDLLAVIDAACDRFESAWQAAGVGGAGPRCEAFAAELPEGLRDDGLRELFAIERQYRAKRGEGETEWAGGRPELESLVGQSGVSLADAATLTGRPNPAPGSGGLRLRCPQCQGRIDLSADADFNEITCNACGSAFGLFDGGDASEATAPRVGRFLLRKRLGVGGFGAVWRARDPELDRDVALKLPRRGGLTPHESEMFFREARAAAQLAHPGIVSVHEVGRDADGGGSIYIVSELVDGESLSERIKEWRPTKRQAAAIVADIADALEYAHGRGVIHRDLKPANIMLDRFSSGGETAKEGLADVGRPRLMDFGLAKRDAGEITMTVDGQVLGTPAYMSPEQASGQMRWVDRRTDLYALGVVMFRLLTGELPFRGDATSQIQQRLTDDAPSPRRLDSAVPLDLATVCLKCLERDPNRRYGAAAEVAAEMRRYLGGEPVLARPLSPWGRAGRWARRRPALATALALGATLAVVGPTAALVIGRQAAKLESQLTERDELIQRQERRVDELEAAKDARGVRPEPQTIDPVRLAAIERLLAKDGPRLLAVATREPPDTPAGAAARAAVARLLIAVGRTQEASALLARMNPKNVAAAPELDRLKEAIRNAEAIRDAAQGGSGRTASKIATLQSATEPTLPDRELTVDDLSAVVGVLLDAERQPGPAESP